MNIAGLRVRITIQKNVTAVDRIGNHTSVWTDYFSCWATAVASGKSAEDSKQYRVLLNGRIYDILNIDDMGFRRNSRKLHTQLVER